MKTYSVFFLILTTLFVVSCSDDKNGKEELLHGTWEFALEGTMIDGNENLEPYQHEEGCFKDVILFKPNKQINHLTYFNNGTDCILSEANGNWSLSNDILVISHGDITEIIPAEILTLNSTTLKYKFNIYDNEADETFVYIYQLNKR
jgi:hypothetical protein